MVVRYNAQHDANDACEPFICQFDASRDLKGIFFDPSNNKEKYKKLMKHLAVKLKTCLSNNGNSFNTCYQFVEEVSFLNLYRRIKIYCKSVAMF